MHSLFNYLGGDRNIWVLTFMLGILSVVSVFSFIPILVKTTELSYTYLFFKHFLLLVLGFVLMYIVHKTPVKVFERMSRFLYCASLVLLVLTLLMGERINGAERWLRIPFVPFSFQTSDFAKLALMMYLSKQLVKQKKHFHNLKVVTRSILIPVGLTLFLILPANLSTAVLIGTTVFALMLLAKFPLKWMALSALATAVVFTGLLFAASKVPEVLPRVATWRNRIVRMFEGEHHQHASANMQVNNALAAIKNGAMTTHHPLPGRGPGNGVLKHYIPEAYADFYFAALIEEGGLPMAVAVIMLYLWLFYRFIKTGLQANQLFATYLSMSIGLIMMTQVTVNMMVSTKLIPVTGQNMPLLSMGGTSAWFTCIAFGMVLAISREQSKERTSTHQPKENALA